MFVNLQMIHHYFVQDAQRDLYMFLTQLKDSNKFINNKYINIMFVILEQLEINI